MGISWEQRKRAHLQIYGGIRINLLQWQETQQTMGLPTWQKMIQPMNFQQLSKSISLNLNLHPGMCCFVCWPSVFGLGTRKAQVHAPQPRIDIQFVNVESECIQVMNFEKTTWQSMMNASQDGKLIQNGSFKQNLY